MARQLKAMIKVMNWYLLKTKPNAHIVAREQLIRQGLKYFYPFSKKQQKGEKKFVINTVPLFPSYLFVGTLRDQVPWKKHWFHSRVKSGDP